LVVAVDQDWKMTLMQPQKFGEAIGEAEALSAKGSTYWCLDPAH